MSPPAPLDIDVKADSDTTTVVVPDPLTVTGVAAWRLQAAKVPTGTAAAASSDMFKSPVRRLVSMALERYSSQLACVALHCRLAVSTD